MTFISLFGAYMDISHSSGPLWHTSTSSTLQVNSVAISGDGQRCFFGTSSEYGDGQFSVQCYSGDGQRLWQQTVTPPDAQQGVFWVAISANGAYSAAGGETAKDSGFLTTFNAACGTKLLDTTLPARVNQVSLSASGDCLLVVFANTVQLYKLNPAGAAFELVSQQDLSPYYLNSAVISENGQTAIVSAMLYSDDGSSTQGAVFNFAVADEYLSLVQKYPLEAAGPMRVAVTTAGEAFGASLHDGSCVIYKASADAQPLWTYMPDKPNLSVAYAFDLTLNSKGQLIVACGANLYDSVNGGYLYLLQTEWTEESDQPELLWDTELDYAANPGVSLDLNACYVTATDGKPSDPPKESPGNFYLFDVASGNQLWQFPTSQMNWPMVIAANGSAAFGGSDNGAVYYWNL